MGPVNLLLSISGPDQAGVTSHLLKAIGSYSHRLLDIDQSLIYGSLFLNLLIEIQAEDQHKLCDHVQTQASKLGLNTKVRVVDLDPADARPAKRYRLSCVSSQELESHFLAEASGLLAKFSHNIIKMEKTDRRDFHALEFKTKKEKDSSTSDLKSELMSLSKKYNVDLALIKDDIWRMTRRLVVLDMDSTLVKGEVINELAALHGVEEKICEITRRAMNGELDFNQSLKERVSLLKGMPAASLLEVKKRLQLNEGAEEFVKSLKELGLKIAVISGGFTYFTEALKDRLGLDYAHSNELEIVDEKLTGAIIGEIVGPDTKARLLQEIAKKENIDLRQTVAIGDGANDLPMLKIAGLGVAYHAKEIVNQKADHSFQHGPMNHILHFLGFSFPN